MTGYKKEIIIIIRRVITRAISEYMTESEASRLRPARTWSSSRMRVIYHNWSAIYVIKVKNFHGSLTTVVRAQNDTSKTANTTDTIFDRTYWYSPYKRRRFEIGEIRRSVSC